MGKSKRNKGQRSDAGRDWFNMPATKQDGDMEDNVKFLNARSLIYPKEHRKDIDIPVPKYSQIGTVIDSPLDFYTSRILKRNRNKSQLDIVLENKDKVKRIGEKAERVVKNENQGGEKHNRRGKKLDWRLFKTKGKRVWF